MKAAARKTFFAPGRSSLLKYSPCFRIGNAREKLGEYLSKDDLPGAKKVLRAAAFTYVAAAMASLLDVVRWLRLLRF